MTTREAENGTDNVLRFRRDPKRCWVYVLETEAGITGVFGSARAAVVALAKYGELAEGVDKSVATLALDSSCTL